MNTAFSPGSADDENASSDINDEIMVVHVKPLCIRDDPTPAGVQKGWNTSSNPLPGTLTHLSQVL